MNMKTIAIAVAAIMAVSFIGVSVSDDSDAMNLDSAANVVSVGQITMDKSATVTLILNDTAYGSGYTIKWSASTWTPDTDGTGKGTTGDFVETGIECDSTNTNGGNIPGVTNPALTIAKSETAGRYTLTITDSNGGTSNIAIRAQITVSYNGTTLALEPVYYTMSIDAIAGITGSTLKGIESKTFTYGTSVPANDSNSGGILKFSSVEGGYAPADISVLTWYAVGLPAGLAMSEDGKIVGVPLQKVTDHKVNLVARNMNTGAEYTGSVTVTVTGGTADTPSGAELSYDVTGTNVVQVGSTAAYIVQQGTAVPLTVTTSGGGAGDAISVTIIDSNGTRTSAGEFTSGKATNITPTGTGTFVVEIGYAGLEAQFTLHVFAQPASDVAADIVVTGGGY